MPHTGKNSVAYRRGLKEAPAAIAALQERWPLAFPRKGHLVRPLVAKVHEQVAETMGWDRYYARAVLRQWKFRVAYSQAVLAHDRRFDLNGAVTEETVEDGARMLARTQLARKRLPAEQRRAQAKAPVTDGAEAVRAAGRDELVTDGSPESPNAAAAAGIDLSHRLS